MAELGETQTASEGAVDESQQGGTADHGEEVEDGGEKAKKGRGGREGNPTTRMLKAWRALMQPWRLQSLGKQTREHSTPELPNNTLGRPRSSPPEVSGSRQHDSTGRGRKRRAFTD